MEITSINTESLSRMFLAGAKNLEAKKEWINELNVFPVPDGDTGTNMSMTIMSAAREVGALSNPTMKELAKAISSGSLRGARGNSGVILSQLFRGFCKVIKEYDEVDVSVLCDAFQKAVETAYKAVMKPKEGTILTVAKGAADKALDLAQETEDLVYFCDEVIKHAEYVLSQTPEMLPVLKQAGVVDSGGQGLVQVLKGAYDSLLGKEIDYSIEETPASAGTAKVSEPAEQEIKYGYCTEFIIVLTRPLSEKEEKEYKSYLESIGDSIVVVADDEVVKTHVHTNDPGLAIQKALTHGSLTKIKIDNMREEHQEKLIKDAEKAAARQKEQEGEANVTTILFDHEVQLLHDRFPLHAVAPLTEKDYYVRGCTALLDAIGYGMEKMVNIQRHLPEDERAEKVIFVITTDGLENASKRFSYEKIRRMIEREKEQYGWEFLFLGANMDAVKEAARFGISSDRAMRFENDAQGVAVNYHVVSETVSRMREAPCCASIGAEWKEQIEADFQKRHHR